MRLVKILFSRFPILVLAVLVQIAALAVVLSYYAQYFVWLEIVGGIMALAVFWHMLCRDTAPEFKLPWLLLLAVFPLLGTVLYVFLATPKLRKRQNKALSEIERYRKEYLTVSPSYREAMEATLGEYGGVEQHLVSAAYSHGFLNNRVDFYGEGGPFFEALLAAIREAREFVFLEYFILSPGQLWERLHRLLLKKRSEGVEVRILYDDLGTLGKLSGRYDKRLAAEGLAARRFNPLHPVLSGIFNYRDHRKIAVIDGKVGFTGGMNIGDEYAGLTNPYGKFKDSGIRLEGAAVGNLTLLFLQLWAAAGRADTDCAKYFPPVPDVRGAGGYAHVFGSGPAPFYREQVAENVLLNLIGAARRRIYVTTPYLIVDRTLMTALQNAAKRGVDVRIVTPHVPDKRVVFQLTRASYPPLLEAGVRIFEYTPGFLHAKQMLVDDEIAFVGTVNLDYRSLSHHFECGAVLCRTPALTDIARDFDGLFAVSGEIPREGFRLGLLNRTAAALLSLFSPLF